jgi:hypothetical protein
MYRSWAYAVLLIITIGAGGCSVWCSDEQKQIELLKSRNAELIIENQSLTKLATGQYQAIETLMQGIQSVRDQLQNNSVQEALADEQRRRDAAIAYWCSWWPVSMFCSRERVKENIDLTLALSDSYFYIGAAILFLLVSLAVSVVVAVAVAFWTVWYGPKKQDYEKVRQDSEDAAAMMQQAIVRGAEVAEQAKQLEHSKSEFNKEKALWGQLLEQTQTAIEDLKLFEFNEKPRIDARLARYAREEKQKSEVEVAQWEKEISEVKERHASANRDLKITLELMQEASVRRKAFGALFRPQKYRQQDSPDPEVDPESGTP